MRTPLLLATIAFALMATAATPVAERERFARDEHNAPAVVAGAFRSNAFAESEGRENAFRTAESEFRRNSFAQSDFRENAFKTAEGEFRGNSFADRGLAPPVLA